MVTLQILVLPFLVRIRVPQPKVAKLRNSELSDFLFAKRLPRYFICKYCKFCANHLIVSEIIITFVAQNDNYK